MRDIYRHFLHFIGNHQNDLTIHKSSSGNWIRCEYCYLNFSPQMKVWFNDDNTKLFYEIEHQRKET